MRSSEPVGVPRAQRRWPRFTTYGLALALSLGTALAHAEDVHVAVAANFASTLEKLAPLFHEKTGHDIVPSSGSSGQLYAQIAAGAPYDVFLSADTQRPHELIRDGLAIPSSRFVYARGRLVLWSAKPGFVDAEGKVLERADLGTVAIADPRAAPYGAAAEKVLRARGQWQRLAAAGKLAVATSITQAHQFVSSGNAVCGFVALAQVIGADGQLAGSSWLIPVALAGPLDQEAVLLERAAKNAAARAFLAFLRQDEAARALIVKAGYELATQPR